MHPPLGSRRESPSTCTSASNRPTARSPVPWSNARWRPVRVRAPWRCSSSFGTRHDKGIAAILKHDRDRQALPGDDPAPAPLHDNLRGPGYYHRAPKGPRRHAWRGARRPVHPRTEAQNRCCCTPPWTNCTACACPASPRPCCGPAGRAATPTCPSNWRVSTCQSSKTGATPPSTTPPGATCWRSLTAAARVAPPRLPANCRSPAGTPSCGEATLADAILARLVHNADKVEMIGESMREQRHSLTAATL